MALYRQVELTQDTRQMTTWVDAAKGLDRGVVITLKDVDGKWKVEKIYDTTASIDQLNTYRHFDNNNYDKHEGLFSK